MTRARRQMQLLSDQSSRPLYSLQLSPASWRFLRSRCRPSLRHSTEKSPVPAARLWKSVMATVHGSGDWRTVNDWEINSSPTGVPGQRCGSDGRSPKKLKIFRTSLSISAVNCSQLQHITRSLQKQIFIIVAHFKSEFFCVVRNVPWAKLLVAN